MTEDDVRRIVREELDAIQREADARTVAHMDQFRAATAEQLADQPDDGPFVREMKATLRGEG